MIYGYCRISTRQQNIERQVRNITKQYPDALIVRETFTGTKYQGRKELERILNQVRSGDTIVFDSVSRMSRNAEEGFTLYEALFKKGVELVFIKEPHINTATYQKALQSQVAMTGAAVDYILAGINRYLLELAREQIRLAFAQAQKEVDDLHQRTKEGMETARLHGKQIGRPSGSGAETQKARTAKEIIQIYNKSFGGQLNNEQTWRLAGISKNSFYKYKQDLLEHC